MLHADICIAGAGVIGLSLALELNTRGMKVVVVEAGHPLGEASTAAAGMLATDDPHNPAELSALSHLSVALYPEFLERLRTLSGVEIPFQTNRTLQLRDVSGSGTPKIHQLDSLTQPGGSESLVPSGFYLLDEHSIDPRQLASALLSAVEATSIHLVHESPVISTSSSANSVLVTTPARTIEAANFINCTGAWSNDPAFQVIPIKGQMLSVALPADFVLKVTVRTKDIYIVPRTTGPNAGRAIVGATVEDVGFDKSVHASQIDELRRQAVALLPQLAQARVIESWSGLRPATPDRLPLLGAHPAKPRHWVAAGHYRNGILLAPATARVVAQLLLNETSSTSLHPFEPSRLTLPTVPRL